MLLFCSFRALMTIGVLRFRKHLSLVLFVEDLRMLLCWERLDSDLKTFEYRFADLPEVMLWEDFVQSSCWFKLLFIADASICNLFLLITLNSATGCYPHVHDACEGIWCI
ncbi:hypothetical protein Dimus_015972 [Dionaea muscipula]